jgi:hypothetical protein
MCQSMHIAPASQVAGVFSDVRNVVSTEIGAPRPSKRSFVECGFETLPRNLTLFVFFSVETAVPAEPRPTPAAWSIDCNAALGPRDPHKCGLRMPCAAADTAANGFVLLSRLPHCSSRNQSPPHRWLPLLRSRPRQPQREHHLQPQRVRHLQRLQLRRLRVRRRPRPHRTYQ